jgi:hypothetical protein
LALGAWASLWLAFSILTRIGQSIAVERDSASGVRLAGLLTAWGLILGRAVAGDWISIQGTFQDFESQAWPSLILLTIACACEFALRPRRRFLFPSFLGAGLVPAILYILGASLWLGHLGMIR